MIKLSIQTDAKDGVVAIIQAAIAAEIKRLELGLHNTNKTIEKFERRYKYPLPYFKKFSAGDLKYGDQGIY